MFPSKEVTSLTRGHPSCQVRFQMHWGSTGNILLNCSPLIRGTKKVYTTKLTSSWKATSTTLLSDKISEVLRKYTLLNLPPHERPPLLQGHYFFCRRDGLTRGGLVSIKLWSTKDLWEIYVTPSNSNYEFANNFCHPSVPAWWHITIQVQVIQI